MLDFLCDKTAPVGGVCGCLLSIWAGYYDAESLGRRSPLEVAGLLKEVAVTFEPGIQARVRIFSPLLIVLNADLGSLAEFSLFL